jgi:hypothetical protein
MVCPFEILHFIPLVAIVGTALFARGKFSRISISVSVFALSVVGLVSGSHVHTAHAEPITFLDPCLGYMLAAAISIAVIARDVIKSKQLS